MCKANNDIRTKLNEIRMKQWQLADGLGISEYTLCVWLRKELPQEKKQEIFEAIDRLGKNFSGQDRG